MKKYDFQFLTKIRFAFTIILLLLVIAFSVFLQFGYLSGLKKTTIRNGQQLCREVSENLRMYISNMDDIAKKLLSDASVQRILRTVEEEVARESVYDSMQRERQIARSVTDAVSLSAFPSLNVYIYSPSRSYTYIYNQDMGSFDHAVSSSSTLQRLSRKQLVICADAENANSGNKEGTISFFRSVFDISGNHYGYVEVQSSLKKMKDIIRVPDVENAALLDNTRETVCSLSPDTEIDKAVFEQTDAGNHSGSVITSGRIIFFNEIGDTGYSAYLSYPAKKFFSPVTAVQNTSLAFLFCIAAAGVFLVYFLSASAKREMVLQKAEAQARLTALQDQISPHFIHNVLYSISITAKEGNSESAARMCKQLSDMMRYTVDSRKPAVHLEEELECVRNYLSLQKIYYEDFLTYEISCDDSLLAMEMPRLCILPFIENTIQHAFDSCEAPYHVRLSILPQPENSGWVMEVEDNGKGFPEKEKALIEEKMKKTPSVSEVEGKKNAEKGLGRVGIINTLQRMNMFFENGIRFEISGGKNSRGTIIRISGKGRQRLRL